MKTNVMKKTESKNLPAGILEGTEAFWHEGEKWVMHHGQATRFHDAPGAVQRMIANAFMNDNRSQKYLKKIGVVGFTPAFEMWYRCVVGDLDKTPDFIDGKFTPDDYNSNCTDNDCPHRGKLCSLKPGLKNYEIATISALKKGYTLERTARDLYITVAGLKSRVDKMKEKLGATNMASLVARADAFGI